MLSTPNFKKFSIAFLLMSICFLANAQTQVWQQTPSVTGSTLSSSKSATHSSGIYTAGLEYVTASGNIKLRITKHNYSGGLLQSVAFPFGNLVTYVTVRKAECDAAGNFYAMFTVNKSNTSNKDCYLLSYSPTLALRWIRLINSSNDNEGIDFVITTSGNLYALNRHRSKGSSITNVGIKKVNMSTGTVAFSGTHTNGNYMTPVKIVVDGTGNSYVCGYSSPNGINNSGFISRFNNAGAHSWTSNYNSSVLYDLTLNNFGTAIYACGFSVSNNAALVVRYNTSGANTAAYSLSNSNKNYFLKIGFETSGAVTVYGNAEITTPSPTSSLLVVKLNANLTSVLSSYSYPTTAAANFYVSGSNISLINHPNGTRTISIDLNSILAGGVSPGNYRVKINTTGGIIYSGYSYGFQSIYPVNLSTHANTDFIQTNNNFTIKRFTGAAARLTDDVASINSNTPDIIAYPNPSTSVLNFTGINEAAQLLLIDMNGKVVLQKVLKPSESIDVSGYNRGMYVASINENGETKNLKLMLE